MVVYKAGFCRLLVLFLGFSFALSSLGVPKTRSPKSTYEKAYSSLEQDFQAQDAMEFDDSAELSHAKEVHMRGRMATDTIDDYPGTGANNNHDPKTPGYY